MKFTLAMVCAGMIALRSTSVAAQENPYAENYFRMLTERGVPTDPEGLKGFLKSHIPGPEDKGRFQQQLAELGDDDYARREAAMQALLARPPKSTDELEKLAAGNDPEIRWRARLVLDHLRQPGNDLLYASLIVITARKIQGLADVVLGVAPLCQSESMQLAMSRALVATATDRDADVLRKNLASDDARVRTACVNALMTAVGEPAAADIVPLLEDKSDLVRFDAASQLLKYRRGDSLRTLGKLLLSEQLTVRNRSIHELRKTLKVSLPYSGYEPPEDRARHAAEWQKTIELNLEEKKPPATSAVTSTTPVQLAFHVRPQRLLILVGNDARCTTRKDVPDHLTYRVIAGGHFLIADRTRRQVLELDGNEKEVWRSGELDEHPLLATRRADGITLVATLENSLLEINAAGDIIRKSTFGPLQDLKPLANNAVLLLTYQPGLIRRIDVTGRLEWASPELVRPTSVCQLADGHLLTALHQNHRLADIDPQGKVAFLETPFQAPSDVQPLADGRLAVLDARGAHIADRRGALVETMVSFAPVGAVN